MTPACRKLVWLITRRCPSLTSLRINRLIVYRFCSSLASTLWFLLFSWYRRLTVDFKFTQNCLSYMSIHLFRQEVFSIRNNLLKYVIYAIPALKGCSHWLRCGRAPIRTQCERRHYFQWVLLQQTRLSAPTRARMRAWCERPLNIVIFACCQDWSL